MEAELEFIRALAATGIPACLPMASVAGLEVESIGGQLHACCFIHAAGMKASWRNPQVWHERTFINWGRLLARLHAASKQLVLPGAYRRMRWDQDDVTMHDYLTAEDRDIARRLTEMVEEIRQLPTADATLMLRAHPLGSPSGHLLQR